MGNQPPLFEKATAARDKGEADRRSQGHCQGGAESSRHSLPNAAVVTNPRHLGEANPSPLSSFKGPEQCAGGSRLTPPSPPHAHLPGMYRIQR